MIALACRRLVALGSGLLLALYTGARLMLDFIGYTTAPDDFAALQDRLPHWLEWLFSTPGWVPAALMTLLTVFVIWGGWPQRAVHAFPSEPPALPTEDSEVDARKAPRAPEDEYVEDRYAPTDAQLYNDLVVLCLDRLVPACEAQVGIQHVVIRRACQNDTIQKYCFAGLRCHDDVKDFFDRYDELYQGLCETSGEIVTLDRLIICLGGVEKTYARMCASTDELASSVEMDVRSEIPEMWEDWRLKHNALVNGYETIKRDSRIPALFRPGRVSRWGGVIT